MSVIPCEKDANLQTLIVKFAEELQVEAHKLGGHGLNEREFYESGILPAAIERLRGQGAATMREKRAFVRGILNYLQDKGAILEWDSSGSKNRHDYTVKMHGSWTAVIELKGCMDGNNTTIFERPANAREFIIWSICAKKGSDAQKNVWSGIHTRLSSEMIEQKKQVDGLIVWDWFCGTIDRPCPKLSTRVLSEASEVGEVIGDRRTTVGQHRLTPPCLYLFPSTVPSVRNNPNPSPHLLDELPLMKAFSDCFNVLENEINSVYMKVENRGSDVARSTEVFRDGVSQKRSKYTPIRRR
jgi:hypothetical protein